MPEIKYTCPKCSATLKPAQPVAAGKKIKCPKCGAAFAPEEEEKELQLVKEDDPKEAAPQVYRKPSFEEDDDGPATYAFNEVEQAAAKKEAEEKNKKSVFDEPLRDHAPKSKRGPAQAAVIPPSNGLLAAGLLTCIGSLIGICVYAFPLIFQDRSSPPTVMKKTASGTVAETKKKSLTEIDKTLTHEQIIEKWINIGWFAWFFLYGCGVTTGAAKMQNLESYKWAVWGSILALIPLGGPFWLLTMPTGLWCLTVLKKPFVKEGFGKPKKRARDEDE